MPFPCEVGLHSPTLWLPLMAAVGTICCVQRKSFPFPRPDAWVESMAFWEIFRLKSSYGVVFVTEIWGRMLMLLRVRRGRGQEGFVLLLCHCSTGLGGWPGWPRAFFTFNISDRSELGFVGEAP